MFLCVSLAERRFVEKMYAAAKMVVAMSTTDAPDGRSKIYDTMRPETQAPMPEAVEMRKNCLRLYVNWSAVAPGCTSNAKMCRHPTVARFDETTAPVRNSSV